MGGCGESRVKHKAGEGRGRGTVFLGISLSIGEAVGTSSFAINWR